MWQETRRKKSRTEKLARRRLRKLKTATYAAGRRYQKLSETTWELERKIFLKWGK